MLLLVFVILKLTSTVSWSWWWVVSPLWMPVALLLVGAGLAAVMGIGILRLVSTVLGRQRFGAAADRGSAQRASRRMEDQVVEAEGTEVTSRPNGVDKRSLPQTASSVEGEDAAT